MQLVSPIPVRLPLQPCGGILGQLRTSLIAPKESYERRSRTWLVIGAVLPPAACGEEFPDGLLPTAVRVGDFQLPQGHCEVTWTEPSGSQVQLTFKSSDKKTVTIPAHVVQEKGKVGVSTFVKDGVTYMQELQTKDKFVIPRCSARSRVAFLLESPTG
jgi:hypothetical protein